MKNPLATCKGTTVVIGANWTSTIHFLEKQFLGVDGHDVYSHYNAKEALETYKAVGPENWDAVITDYQMPGMTGLELIEEIRKLRSDQHVILQTSETKRLVPSSIPQLHKPYPTRTAGVEAYEVSPHVQLRNALLDDHVKAGWVDSDMFLAYCIMLRHCDWKTGISQSSADALVSHSGYQWSQRTVAPKPRPRSGTPN